MVSYILFSLETKRIDLEQTTREITRFFHFSWGAGRKVVNIKKHINILWGKFKCMWICHSAIRSQENNCNVEKSFVIFYRVSFSSPACTLRVRTIRNSNFYGITRGFRRCVIFHCRYNLKTFFILFHKVEICTVHKSRGEAIIFLSIRFTKRDQS